MLYLLLYPWADQFQAFNLFRYITFRSGGAVVTALLISFVFGPQIIAGSNRSRARGSRFAPTGRKAIWCARRARRRWAGS
jgi:phospho-N-acetylmuramoyl-pentapeptide-transferase